MPITILYSDRIILLEVNGHSGEATEEYEMKFYGKKWKKYPFLTT